MARNFTSTLIKIIFMSIFCFLSTPPVVSLAEDFMLENPGRWLIKKSVLVENMAISYHGRTANASDTSGHIFSRSDDGMSTSETPERIGRVNTENSVDLGKRIETLSAIVRKYVSIGSGSSNALIPHFKPENETGAKGKLKNGYDLNLSFRIGYDDESGNVSINAVKVSSYFLFTHLDAVYDSNNNDIDFFLSNAVINMNLIKGMAVELKVSPSTSSGAVLLTRKF